MQEDRDGRNASGTGSAPRMPRMRRDGGPPFRPRTVLRLWLPGLRQRLSPDAIRGDHLGSVYSDDNFFSGGDGYQDYLVEADLLRAQFQ